MKAVLLCVLVFVAVLGRAQNLQYEQAAYTDNAAPAPFEQTAQAEEQPMTNQDSVVESDESDESSFAEMEDSAAPGALSKAAHKVGKAIQNVKNLFKSRKNKGGNISPSAPPKAKAKKPALVIKPKKPASKKPKKAAAPKAKRNPGLKSLGKKKPAVKKAVLTKKPRILSKPHRRPAPRPGRGRKPRRPIRVPRPPPAANGPVDDLFHSERIIPATSENRDPEMAKLNLALEAVKEDILSTNKQINDERRWVIAVGKIIKSYNTKMARVEQHIIALRKEMKALYRKKKQIENLKLQKALEAKLKEAKAELATLTNSLKHVAKKQGELNKSGRDLRQTIAGIQGQLAKLRGQQMLKKCKRGTRYSRKAKKCVSICKSGQIFNAKSKKCVSRCRKGSKWSKKARKCLKARSKRSKRSKRASRK